MSAPEIAVWIADVDALGGRLDEIAEASELLPPDERYYGSSQTRPDLTNNRRRARIALRLLLLKAGVPEARGMPFSRGRNGKPALPGCLLAFSLSHTGNLALIAISHRGPLGVDLEVPRRVQLGPERRGLIIAAGYGLALGMLPRQAPSAPMSDTDFLVAWTRLEAMAKARGDGIGNLLTELGITASAVRTTSGGEIFQRATGLASSSGLRVVDLELPFPGSAAICAPAVQLPAPPNCHSLTEADLSL